MTMLIVEGGKTSLEIMALMPLAVLVSEDEELLTAAAERFPDARIHRGPWSTELLREYEVTAVVLGYEEDGANLLIGRRLMASGDLKVACFCQDPTRMPEFREAGIINIYCPSLMGARVVAASLDPRVRDLIEIPIFGDSPLLGKKVDDIQYGVGAMVVGLLDGQEIVRPEGRYLEKGNHMLIATMGVKPESLQKVIVRKEARLRIFRRVLALIRSADELSGALQEAAYLANAMSSDLAIILGDEELVEPTQEALKSYGLRYCLEVADLSSLEAIEERLLEEELGRDCVLMPVWDDMVEKRSFRKWRFRALMDRLDCSFLLSKKRQPYFSTLTLMDGSEEMRGIVESAFKVAFLARASLKVLSQIDDLSSNGEENTVRSMSKLYGVKGIELPVEGNPTVEFVSQLQSGKVDLAVLGWGCRLLREDIVGRAIAKGPVSLLFLRG